MPIDGYAPPKHKRRPAVTIDDLDAETHANQAVIMDPDNPHAWIKADLLAAFPLVEVR